VNEAARRHRFGSVTRRAARDPAGLPMSAVRRPASAL
jgi:hypothetical protein